MAPFKGAVVVIAGPGSGKTTVLVERIAYLLASGAAPESLLVCTFTRAAAEELQHRLKPKLHHKPLPYCGTMHSLAYKMLGGAQGLITQGLTLISEDEIAALLPVFRTQAPNESELSDSEFLLQIQRAQEGSAESSVFMGLASLWEEELSSLGYADFVMLLKLSLSLPRRRSFRFALGDEAQDLTPLQLLWLHKHCAADAHTYLVGDDDQAVYAFRGSAQAVLSDEVGRGARCYQLRENWRCRAEIVLAAQRLIAHNTQRVAEPQIPVRREGAVTTARFKDEIEELLMLKAAKTPPVVLCRTRKDVERFQLEGLEAYTIHEAKGREWPFVWISGLEQGLLPIGRADIEEERRLMYVAITRARDRLVVAVRDKVADRGRQPSQFLKEFSEK
jgi:superfamily I DNA/RNA helicase